MTGLEIYLKNCYELQGNFKAPLTFVAINCEDWP